MNSNSTHILTVSSMMQKNYVLLSTGLLIMVLILQSCSSNKSLKKYCCRELNVYNCNKGILNEIYSDRCGKKFTVRVYTVMSPNAHGNYFVLTYGRNKLLIKEHADSAISMAKFDEFTKNIELGDSIKNVLKEKILFEAQSRFHRGL